MNTLPRTVTAQFFTAPDHYIALREHWSALMRSPRRHELSAAHHLLYLVLLGKDWRKAFTPTTNRRKLQNGAFVGWVLFHALWMLHSDLNAQKLLAPFEGRVTLQALHAVRKLMPRLNPYKESAEMFLLGSCPFDAYCTEGIDYDDLSGVSNV